MKIIKKDNFDRETVSDVLICSDVGSFYGSIIVEMLNKSFSGEHSNDYFKVVPDDYKLYQYNP